MCRKIKGFKTGAILMRVSILTVLVAGNIVTRNSESVLYNDYASADIPIDNIENINIDEQNDSLDEKMEQNPVSNSVDKSQTDKDSNVTSESKDQHKTEKKVENKTNTYESNKNISKDVEVNSSVTESNNSMPVENNSTSNNASEKQTDNNSKVNEEPTVDLTKIVETRSLTYSFHKGVIEFSDRESCLQKNKELAFVDTVDIISFNCVEVMSKADTVMGYFLYIKCHSGNCNKYK